MRYLVIYEQGEAGFGAFVPDLPGCVAVGDSEAEVRERIREAAARHLEALRAEGRPAPAPACRTDTIELP